MNTIKVPTQDEVIAEVIEILTDIAPEVEAESLDPAIGLRDQIDIDSIDFLTLMIGVYERFGVDVPESDYGRVMTLDALAAYVVSHLDRAQAEPSGQ